MPLEQQRWESESFAWTKYPQLLAKLGFKDRPAASLLIQEVYWHQARLGRIQQELMQSFA